MTIPPERSDADLIAQIGKDIFDRISRNVLARPELEVMKLDESATLPTKANPGDLGYDLYALEDVTLNPGVVTKVRTGIACNFPVGYGALLRDRSSIATKKEIFVVAGVIDEGYTGEILVAFFNPGHLEQATRYVRHSHGDISVEVVQRVGWCGPERFQRGDKIAQMILMPVVDFPVVEVTELNSTERGSNGFGSSGT
jgi:dUTP pyrophosphatase